MSYQKVALRLAILIALFLSAAPGIFSQDAQDPSSKPRNVKPELKKAYKDWLDHDVAYIITDEERKAFKKLATDDERERFIEEFWRRRDPTPIRMKMSLKKSITSALHMPTSTSAQVFRVGKPIGAVSG
jgi:hypothetical protein